MRSISVGCVLINVQLYWGLKCQTDSVYTALRATADFWERFDKQSPSRFQLLTVACRLKMTDERNGRSNRSWLNGSKCQAHLGPCLSSFLQLGMHINFWHLSSFESKLMSWITSSNRRISIENSEFIYTITRVTPCDAWRHDHFCEFLNLNMLYILSKM